MQAHAGGDRVCLPQVLDAWRIQAVARGIDREAVRQVSGVLIEQLRNEKRQLAPLESSEPKPAQMFSGDVPLPAETYARAQRSRDGPNGF
jgi:hypothetical protein